MTGEIGVQQVFTPTFFRLWPPLFGGLPDGVFPLHFRVRWACARLTRTKNQLTTRIDHGENTLHAGRNQTRPRLPRYDEEPAPDWCHPLGTTSRRRPAKETSKNGLWPPTIGIRDPSWRQRQPTLYFAPCGDEGRTPGRTTQGKTQTCPFPFASQADDIGSAPSELQSLRRARADGGDR